MPIQLTCPNGHRLTAKDEHVGRTLKCPACQTPVTVPIVDSPPPPPPAKQLFCTNCGNSVSEQAVACMSCGAKPTGHKKFCRQCGVAVNPEQIVCVKCGANITGRTIIDDWGWRWDDGKQLDAKQRKARIQFWTTLCILACVIVSLVAIVGKAGRAAVPTIAEDVQKKSGISYERAKEVVQKRIEITYIVLFVPTLLAYLSCYYFYLYRLWEEIPGEIARTTPGNAAGLALIPLFNYYWQFIVFGGLYRNMNEVMESYNHKQRFKVSLVQIVCVVWLGVDIISLVFSASTITNEDMIISGGSIIFAIMMTIFTILVYWFVCKDVLKFIDMKSSIEK